MAEQGLEHACAPCQGGKGVEATPISKCWEAGGCRKGEGLQVKAGGQASRGAETIGGTNRKGTREMAVSQGTCLPNAFLLAAAVPAAAVGKTNLRWLQSLVSICGKS